MGQVEVPTNIRLRLVHAYLQMLADELGVDILHVKGESVHPELQPGPRMSLDVDIIVRPSQVDLIVRELKARGWEKMTGFEEGSAFSHAMNLRHDLGLVDLHRQWPGFEIDPSEAFEKLWKARETQEIAEVACAVPGLKWQRLILLLHYGRSGGQRLADFERNWVELSEPERQEIRALAQGFRASVALAAATGDLEKYRSDPSYRLWRYFARGQGSRTEEWLGRWSAARGAREKLRVARGFVMVNHDLLRVELGHEPDAAEIRAAYVKRVTTAINDVKTMARRVRRKGRS